MASKLSVSDSTMEDTEKYSPATLSSLRKKGFATTTVSLSEFRSQNEGDGAIASHNNANTDLDRFRDDRNVSSHSAVKADNYRRARAAAAHAASQDIFNFRAESVGESVSHSQNQPVVPNAPPFLAFLKNLPSACVDSTVGRQSEDELTSAIGSKLNITPLRARIIKKDDVAVMAFVELASLDNLRGLLAIGNFSFKSRLLPVTVASESQRDGVERIFGTPKRSSVGGARVSNAADLGAFRRDGPNAVADATETTRAQLTALNLPLQPPFRAYVGNLAADVTEEAVRKLFDEMGVEVVKMTQIKQSNPSASHPGADVSSFVFVDFADEDQLRHVVSQSGTAGLCGRKFVVALPKPQAQCATASSSPSGGLGGRHRDDVSSNTSGGADRWANLRGGQRVVVSSQPTPRSHLSLSNASSLAATPTRVNTRAFDCAAKQKNNAVAGVKGDEGDEDAMPMERGATSEFIERAEKDNRNGAAFVA